MPSRRSTKSQAIADLPIGARGGLRHHRGTANTQCPPSSTVARDPREGAGDQPPEGRFANDATGTRALGSAPPERDLVAAGRRDTTITGAVVEFPGNMRPEPRPGQGLWRTQGLGSGQARAPPSASIE